MKHLKKRYVFLIAVGALAVLMAVFILTVNLIVIATAADNVGEPFEDRDACAVVLGAKVHEGGRLSDMLRDRMETAILLYKEGKVLGDLVAPGSKAQIEEMVERLLK
jgi:vancomycin permeability regulator SanA